MPLNQCKYGLAVRGYVCGGLLYTHNQNLSLSVACCAKVSIKMTTVDDVMLEMSDIGEHSNENDATLSLSVRAM